MTKRIAITGPDGAGKTTVCEELSQRLGNCPIEYGGKARNHKLKSTRFAHSVMTKAQAFWAPLYFPFRYFWFYFFEYFENRARFKRPDDGVDYIIFDRHPIDRLVLPSDIDLKLEHGRISRLRWLAEKLPRAFWAWIYRHFFDAPVAVFVLLPEPELCFERSNGQYPSIKDAEVRVESYRITIEKLEVPKHYTAIEVSESTTVDSIIDQIVNHLNATKP